MAIVKIKTERVVSELLTFRLELIIARLRIIANKGTCERYEGDEQIVFVNAGMNAPRGSFCTRESRDGTYRETTRDNFASRRRAPVRWRFAARHPFSTALPGDLHW